jgi:sialic acid synthase SpsE
MIPEDFKKLVHSTINVEQALGQISFNFEGEQSKSLAYRRSLFVVEDIEKGEAFSEMNTRSIRPGYVLHTRYLEIVLGKKATQDIKKGTPLSWNMVMD